MHEPRRGALSAGCSGLYFKTAWARAKGEPGCVKEASVCLKTHHHELIAQFTIIITKPALSPIFFAAFSAALPPVCFFADSRSPNPATSVLQPPARICPLPYGSTGAMALAHRARQPARDATPAHARASAPRNRDAPPPPPPSGYGAPVGDLGGGPRAARRAGAGRRRRGRAHDDDDGGGVCALIRRT